MITVWLAGGVVALAGLWLADRLLRGAEARGWIYYRARRGSPETSAAAAMTLQALFQPEAQHAVQQIVHRQASREDDEGAEGPRGGHR